MISQIRKGSLNERIQFKRELLEDVVKIKILQTYSFLKSLVPVEAGTMFKQREEYNQEIEQLRERHNEMVGWYNKNLISQSGRKFRRGFFDFGYLNWSDKDYLRFLEEEIGFVEVGGLIKETITDDPFRDCGVRKVIGNICYVPQSARIKFRNEKKAWASYQKCRGGA